MPWTSRGSITFWPTASLVWGSDALLSIHSAPFFQGLPEESLYGLAEADPISNGWDALRGHEHLNRKTRKKLWSSKHWIVHLFAGKRANEEVMFLERQGFAVLELDLERGKTHDVCNPLVWRALEWGARSGRIVAVIGGPPQNTFMLRRHMSLPRRSGGFRIRRDTTLC